MCLRGVTYSTIRVLLSHTVVLLSVIKKVLPLAHLEKTYHTCDTKQVLLSRRSRENWGHGKR